ncbi:hypothetical protein D9757_004093 [Collybiopsis confluens]|uniref:Chromo domain-containing protein n=1 Tax=Collybiopsis confluens TaxID=2823264 RepID=A0A8H5HUZ4_9AGAR|nr:hypothetical protein D9757_004093 [Collybiopsis confluens]
MSRPRVSSFVPRRPLGQPYTAHLPPGQPYTAHHPQNARSSSHQPPHPPHINPVNPALYSSDLLTIKIMDAIAPILISHQAGTIAKMESIEKNMHSALQPIQDNVKTLGDDMSQNHESIQKAITGANLALQQSLMAHTQTLRDVLGRVQALERVIGKSGEDAPNSIATTLDTVNHTMGELLERVIDPFAATEPVVKHDMAISPTRRTHPSSESIDPVIVRHEMGVSPIRSPDSDQFSGINGGGFFAIQPIVPGLLKRYIFPDTRHSPYRLRDVDWGKHHPGKDTSIARAHVNFFRTDFSLSHGQLYSDIQNIQTLAAMPSLSSSHVPSSRNPSAIPTFIPQTPSSVKDKAHSKFLAAANKELTTSNLSHLSRQGQLRKMGGSSKTRVDIAGGVAARTGGSPSPSVLEEDSVLRMVTHNPGAESSAQGSPILSKPKLSADLFATTSASALFSLDPDDALSDLTSLSDDDLDVKGEGSSGHTRPRKRIKISRIGNVATSSPRKRQRNSKPVVRGGSVRVKRGPRAAGSESAIMKRSKDRIVKSNVSWPKKADDHGTHVQCDVCERWYHCGCVGFASGDSNLEQMKTFECPLCACNRYALRFHLHGLLLTNVLLFYSPIPLSDDTLEQRCARPDCSVDYGDDEFFVERIIGRRTKVESVYGKKQLWLVKWLNYPVWRATWEGNDSLGGNAKLIDTFTEDLESEGIADDPSSTLLLKEASDGGWNVDEPDVIHDTR